MRSFLGAFIFASASKAFILQSPLRGLHRIATSTLPLKMVSTTNDFNQAKQRISEAISIGAPAYNAGDIKKCAEVYRDTAKDIAPLLPSAFKSKLLRETNDESDTNKNYDAKAWALRKVFDSIVEYQLPLMPQNVSDQNISFAPFTTSQIGEPVGVMDNVMGGISNGSWVAKSNVFFGETSLANNGGFASIRWRFQNVQNWSYAKGIYIKGLKHSNADEHTFRIILKDATCEKVRLANFKAVFASPEQADQPLLIPFSVFDQMEQMGRAMIGSPAFNPLGVTEIGLMAIKPTVVGQFQLEFF